LVKRDALTKPKLWKQPYKKVLDHLHYRIVDVSSLKEVAKRWSPETAAKAPVKKALHRAHADIVESIREAKYYKSVIFQSRSA
jgi:oligoribonuclease